MKTETVKLEKTVSDVLKHEPIYPDLEKIDNSQLLNKKFKIRDVEILPSSFGGDFAVAMVEVDGKIVSTSFGSKVVVAQLKKLKHQGDIPIDGTLVQEKSKNNNIYQKLI